jgi:adenylate cyclase
MTTRRLAAILAADVVGYSRMIGVDEGGTLSKLASLRREIIDPLITEHDGRIFKTTGDGLLAEFPSTVQALRCAIVVQERARSGELQLRIGVHQGDVVVEGDDLLGDGINVAARLEGLAEPGGICISSRVLEDAAGKVSLDVEDLGEPDLKNITQRHRVFRVHPERPERPTLPLPDKPSIAVLPFQNMSGDPEQEYFADGMVEEIITGLSRVRSFFVIARNSSFAYKRKSPDVRQVGRELGVRYVLEGSVRKGGNRLRIAAQLVDATTGAHLWADRFDGGPEDVFDLQDRVTGNVVAAIEPRVIAREIERAQRKPTENLQAYDLFLRALPHAYSLSREGNEEAKGLLRQATQVDPTFASAFALMARCHWTEVVQGWAEPIGPTIVEVVRLARIAWEHGGDDPDVLTRVASMIAWPGGDMQGGLALLEKALVLNPNSLTALMIGSQLYSDVGDTEKAIAYAQRAARLNPLTGDLFRNFAIAKAHFVAGRYEAAAEFAKMSLRDNPNAAHSLRWLAASLGLLDRTEEGQGVVQRLLGVSPGLTVSRERTRQEIHLHSPMKVPGVLDAYYEGLRRAGLPE